MTGVLVEKSAVCISETGADSDILKRVFQWQFDNNDTGKKFNFCLFKNSGLSDEAGHFYVDNVLALYEYSDQKDEIEKVITECNSIVANNPLDTMYKILQCFLAKTPVLLLPKID